MHWEITLRPHDHLNPEHGWGLRFVDYRNGALRMARHFSTYADATRYLARYYAVRRALGGE